MSQIIWYGNFYCFQFKYMIEFVKFVKEQITQQYNEINLELIKLKQLINTYNN